MEAEEKIQNPIIISEEIKDFNSWDEWLEKTESFLKEQGYRKYSQGFKNCDFAYWKSFNRQDEWQDKIYQVGLLFYDFRVYQKGFNIPERIGIQYECMLQCEYRIDLSVSKDISLEEFEKMSEAFYLSMGEFIKK